MNTQLQMLVSELKTMINVKAWDSYEALTKQMMDNLTLSEYLQVMEAIEDWQEQEITGLIERIDEHLGE